MKTYRYAHVSAPIVTATDKDGVAHRVVQRPGKTLRIHGDRRIRLTMERIEHGKGRGARRRAEIRAARA